MACLLSFVLCLVLCLALCRYYASHMAWPDDSLTEGETIVTSCRPHWKLLLIPGAWGLGVLVVFSLFERWVNALFLVRAGVALLVLVWFVVRPLVNWWFTRYVLTSERLVTRKGLIAQSGIEIPLERITNVNFSQNGC